MKKVFITGAVLAVLCAMSVSCQKERLDEPQKMVMNNESVRIINYVVDDVESSVVLHNDTAWMLFLDNMFDLSRQGHSVTVYDVGAFQDNMATDETLTYVTTIKNEAVIWTSKKVEEGYRVTVIYNDSTGEYTCIATR